MESSASGDAVARLDELTRKLRRECPWDREQDERSIVPHTVGEAYELAAGRACGDDAKLVDELGDVLFQVHFLSLLLEERGHGSMAQVADHVHAKLVRRHPHIFGDVEVDCAGPGAPELGRDQEGRGRAASPGSSATCRRTCPGRSTRSRRSAERPPRASTSTTCPTRASRGELEELEAAQTREERFHEVGDVLFAAINVARKLKVDPELALRAASERFQGRVEAAAEIAARDGHDWDAMDTEAQLGYYAQARIVLGR